MGVEVLGETEVDDLVCKRKREISFGCLGGDRLEILEVEGGREGRRDEGSYFNRGIVVLG